MNIKLWKSKIKIESKEREFRLPAVILVTPAKREKEEDL